jgi:hypothetical protein
LLVPVRFTLEGLITVARFEEGAEALGGCDLLVGLLPLQTLVRGLPQPPAERATGATRGSRVPGLVLFIEDYVDPGHTGMYTKSVRVHR